MHGCAYALQFLVVIVVDGREKMSKSVEEYCRNALHLWQPEQVQLTDDGNAVSCHMFEKTVILPKHSSQNKNYSPLQVALVVKEKNGGKLNSHLWFFSGIVRLLNPEFCIVSQYVFQVVCRSRNHAWHERLSGSTFSSRALNPLAELLSWPRSAAILTYWLRKMAPSMLSIMMRRNSCVCCY